MADQLPTKYADLLNKKAFANLATLNRDGSPQVTPVWVDFDGTHIRVNTAVGRLKDVQSASELKRESAENTSKASKSEIKRIDEVAKRTLNKYVINADTAVTHGRVIHTLDVLKSAGIVHSAFGTSPEETTR